MYVERYLLQALLQNVAHAARTYALYVQHLPSKLACPCAQGWKSVCVINIISAVILRYLVGGNILHFSLSGLLVYTLQ